MHEYSFMCYKPRSGKPIFIPLGNNFKVKYDLVDTSHMLS